MSDRLDEIRTKYESDWYGATSFHDVGYLLTEVFALQAKCEKLEAVAEAGRHYRACMTRPWREANNYEQAGKDFDSALKALDAEAE